MNRRYPLIGLVIAALSAGSGGCQYFSWLHPRPKAKAVATRVLPATLTPAGPDALLNRLYADAVAAMRRRDYATALDLLQMARGQKADDPRVLTAMGVIYDKLGRFDLSDRYYTLAEAADPGSRVVAIDRAYSERLQRAGAAIEGAATRSSGGGEGMLLARIEANHPVTALSRLEAADTGRVDLADAARLPDIIREQRLGGGVKVRDATGQIGGANPIKARLAQAGWSLDPAALAAAQWAPAASPVSRIVYPEEYARVARALARTLPISTTLQLCYHCRRLEVVVGRDTLSRPRAHGPEARRA